MPCKVSAQMDSVSRTMKIGPYYRRFAAVRVSRVAKIRSDLVDGSVKDVFTRVVH